MADILDGFEACSLADCKSLDVLSDSDDHSCTLVSCALDSHIGHLGQVPVIEHVVNVAEADSGGIELDEDIARA